MDNSRRRARAHRVSYEMMIGPIPEGGGVKQKCFNHACVSPGHLELILSASSCEADRNRAKLTETDIQYMRGMCDLSTPDTLHSKKAFLVEEYSIDHLYLDDILSKSVWKYC